MRIWFKMIKENRLLCDLTVENEDKDTRTHKIFKAIEQMSYAFDLGQPIWLESNISEFKRHAKTRFTQDSFVEQITFDFVEMQVLEEDSTFEKT